MKSNRSRVAARRRVAQRAVIAGLLLVSCATTALAHGTPGAAVRDDRHVGVLPATPSDVLGNLAITTFRDRPDPGSEGIAHIARRQLGTLAGADGSPKRQIGVGVAHSQRARRSAAYYGYAPRPLSSHVFAQQPSAKILGQRIFSGVSVTRRRATVALFTSF